MINERQLALDVITQVTEYGEYLNRVLDEALTKYSYLKKEQRAFITRLSIGTVERRLTLDHVIGQYATTRMDKMDPAIRNILRLSVYQILYMDRIPDSAACNEAVKLAEKNRLARLKGFVNGVLRGVARNKETIAASLQKMAKPTSKPSSRSIAYSVPQWIIEMWDAAYGPEQATAICRDLCSHDPVTTIRVNTLKISRADYVEKLKNSVPEVKVTEDEDLPYVLHLTGYDRIAALPGYDEGLFYVQDKSSMMPVALSGVQPGDTCIDVCAAPGGKTSQLMQLMQGQGRVYARDLSERKVELIRENIRKFLPEGAVESDTGYRGEDLIVSVTAHDALELDAALLDAADVVIADLPCSGLGVLANKPDIRYRVTAEDVRSLATLQQDILQVVSQYTKIGGKLVFSTCTITPYENEQNATAFAEAHPNYKLLEMRQLYPAADRQDGFFIARFQRLS